MQIKITNTSCTSCKDKRSQNCLDIECQGDDEHYMYISLCEEHLRPYLTKLREANAGRS